LHLKRKDLKADRRKLNNDELHKLYVSPKNYFGVKIKAYWVGWICGMHRTNETAMRFQQKTSRRERVKVKKKKKR
jgi:hypothetical protein